MEKGNAAEFKNKSLDEIDIDMDTIDEDTDDEVNENSNNNLDPDMALQPGTVKVVDLI